MHAIEPIAVPINDACRVLSIGRTKLYHLAAAGELPLVKIGRRTLVPVAALRAFVDARVKEAA